MDLDKTTRMHSSRMRTAHLLTIYCSIMGGKWESVHGRCLPRRGCLPGGAAWQGICPGGVYLWSRGWGVCPGWGEMFVSSPGGAVSAQRGVSLTPPRTRGIHPQDQRQTPPDDQRHTPLAQCMLGYTPCGQIDTCENITFANFISGY